MRVAVVGAGTMGGRHAELLADVAEVDQVLVIDADAARASEVAERSGGRAADLSEALDEADAVVIATPPALHAELVDAALSAGVHVLCEKPLTDDLPSTIALTRRIEAEGAHVEVAFQRRHDRAFMAARDAVAGRVHVLRLTAHDPLVARGPEPIGPAPDAAPFFRDSSIHDFDMVRWLSGEEVGEVSALGGRRDGTEPADPRHIESAVVSMRLSGGGLAALEASWLHPFGYDNRIEIVADGTAVTAGLSPRTPVASADGTLHAPADGWSGYLDRFDAAYRAQLEAFLACCRGVRPPAATARDGLEAMRVAVAATRAVMERRPVALDEVAGLPRREVA